MKFIPEWERLDEARVRLMEVGWSQTEAEIGICRALVDGKIRTRPSPSFITRTLHDHQILNHYRHEIFAFVKEVKEGKNPYPHPFNGTVPFSLSNLHGLKPEHIDWEKSCFKELFSVPLNPDMPPFDWEVTFELFSQDVSRVLIESSGDATAIHPKFRAAARPKAEIEAAAALADEIARNSDLTRVFAIAWLKGEGFTVSSRAFQNFVWPAAREQAGLPAKAAPGRKRIQKPD